MTHYLAQAKKTDFGDIKSGNAMDYRQMQNNSYPATASGTDWEKARQQQKFNFGKIANPWGESSYGNAIGVILDQGGSIGTYMRISESVYQAMGENDTAEISYQLATPITYTLTPQQINTLIGTNNIWSDAGDVTVTYTK